MSDTSTKKPTNDKSPLVSQQLQGLESEMTALLDDLGVSGDQIDLNMIEHIKPLMRTPNWQLKINVKISGISGDLRIRQEMSLHFGLDLTSLFSTGLIAKGLDLTSLAIQAKEVGGMKLGDELAEVVTDAVTPLALGRLETVRSKKFSILFEGEEVDCHLPTAGYALLRRADKLVWLQFPWLLTPRTPEGGSVYVLDSQLFRDHVYVVEQAFMDADNVTQRFHWEDLSGNNNLQIEMKAVFSRS